MRTSLVNSDMLPGRKYAHDIKKNRRQFSNRGQKKASFYTPRNTEELKNSWCVCLPRDEKAILQKVPSQAWQWRHDL